MGTRARGWAGGSSTSSRLAEEAQGAAPLFGEQLHRRDLGHAAGRRAAAGRLDINDPESLQDRQAKRSHNSLMLGRYPARLVDRAC
jgi:hypothetical protein